MQGKCYYCNKELTERTIKRHMKNCLEMKKVIEENMKETKGKGLRNQFIISIKDKYNPSVYCIYVSIDEKLQLQHLDKFIRDIWVECCGHLSAFYIDKESYNDNSDGQYKMNYYLKDVLSLNKKFEYKYDFGSTTELVLEVVDIIKVPKEFTQIEIIARNNALHQIEYLNSPRDGVCGYFGAKDAEIPYLPQNNKKYKSSQNKPVHNSDFRFDYMYDDDIVNFSKMETSKHINELHNNNESNDFDDVEQMMSDEFYEYYSKEYDKAIDSFTDMFLKGKYSFDLKELIESYTKKKINNLAENIGLKINSNLKKSEIIEKYVNEYEDIVENKMNTFNEEIYKILQNYIKNNGIMYVSKDEVEKDADVHAFLMKEGIIFPSTKNKEPIFIMPEVMQNIVKKSDTINFRRLMKRNREVINIFKGMVKAYGVIYFDDAKELMKRYEIGIDESVLFAIFEQGSFGYDSEYYISIDKNERTLYIDEEIDDYEIILNKIDKNSEYAMISKEELISMSDEEYLEKSNLGKKFISEFSSMFVMDKDDILDNMDLLASDIQYRDSKEILKDVLNGVDVKLDREDEDQVCNAINKLIRNIRLWRYKGVTLNEKEGRSTTIENKKSIGRNDLCPCNSGKKYRNCCGKNGNVIQLF